MPENVFRSTRVTLSSAACPTYFAIINGGNVSSCTGPSFFSRQLAGEET